MRLFIAIELPEEIRQILAGLQRDMAGVRWVPWEQLHLTLLFLGEVGEGELEMLYGGLKKIRFAPFSLNFTRPGCFPRSGNPRVLWFGVDGQPALERLASRVKAAMAACGISFEERPFHPHITLARIRQPEAGALLKGYIDHPVALQIPALAVREFVLFQSRLTQQGAVHLSLKVFPCATH
ncbi:MAG: RNA 2',3'-cyclic phosphodiesterase [Desulfuromonadales bacterium]|nr:RNA 2',3'-cyclic phosphodiesterase [Desulfuromonadales bacterium]